MLAIIEGRDALVALPTGFGKSLIYQVPAMILKRPTIVVSPLIALMADQEGVYVFVVEDGKAAVKRIKTGGASGTDIVVESGLNGGEQVIVEGTQALRVGMPVQATPMPPAIKRS
jgi:multidrug efflux pump subunit AcrA (membrane-fusion protein)